MEGEPSSSSKKAPQAKAVQRTLWPAGASEESAPTITVSAGIPADLGTIGLTLAKLPSVRAGLHSARCEDSTTFVVQLSERHGGFFITRTSASLRCNSAFVISNVSPGLYRLAAWSAGKNREYAEEQVAVGREGLRVFLDARPEFAIVGSVQLPSGSAEDLLTPMRISLSPIGSPPFAGDLPAAPDRKGDFSLTTLARGTVEISVGGLKDGWAVEDLVYNGVKLAGSVFALDPNAGSQSIRIILTNTTGSLQGVVSTNGPAPKVLVLLARWPLRWRDDYPEFKSISVDETGSFVGGGFLAGDYRIVAVDETVKPMLENSAVVSGLLSAAKSIQINSGEVNRVSLQLTAR